MKKGNGKPRMLTDPIINRANIGTVLDARFCPYQPVSIRGLISSPTAWSRHLDLLRLIPTKSGLKIKKWISGNRISAFRVATSPFNLTFPSNQIASSRAYSCLKKLFPRFRTAKTAPLQFLCTFKHVR
jgi:hypothetical protein